MSSCHRRASGDPVLPPKRSTIEPIVQIGPFGIEALDQLQFGAPSPAAILLVIPAQAGIQSCSQAPLLPSAQPLSRSYKSAHSGLKLSISPSLARRLRPPFLSSPRKRGSSPAPKRACAALKFSCNRLRKTEVCARPFSVAGFGPARRRCRIDGTARRQAVGGVLTTTRGASWRRGKFIFVFSLITL